MAYISPTSSLEQISSIFLAVIAHSRIFAMLIRHALRLVVRNVFVLPITVLSVYLMHQRGKPIMCAVGVSLSCIATFGYQDASKPTIMTVK